MYLQCLMQNRQTVVDMRKRDLMNLFLQRRQHSFLEENFPEVSLHRSSSLILYLMLCTIWSNHLEMHRRLYLHLDVMQQQNIRRSVIPERVLTNSSVVIICTETQNVMVRI